MTTDPARLVGLAASPSTGPAVARPDGVPQHVRLLPHVGLVGMLLVPAIMVVILLAGLHAALRESIAEEAREEFAVAVARMTMAAHPREILHGSFLRTFPGGTTDLWACPASVPALVRRMKEFVGASCTLYVFGPGGTMLWPEAGVPDRAGREAMWQGYRISRKPGEMTVAKRRQEVAGRRFLLAEYGEANYGNIVNGRIFRWELRGRTPPVWVAAIHLNHYLEQDKFSLVWIEVDPTRLGVARVASETLAAMPVATTGAAAVVDLASGTVAVRGAFGGDPLSAAVRLPRDEIVVERGAVMLSAALPYTASAVLVLARPLPWPLALPPWVYGVLATVLLMVAGGVARHLALAIAGVRRVRAGLGLQLLAAFAVSASVPMVALIYLGAVRLINFERAEQGRWFERMADDVATIDRGFRDTIEARQNRIRVLARRLDAASDLPRELARGLPPDLADPDMMCFIDAHGRSHMPLTRGRRESRDGQMSALPQLDKIGELVAQVVEQIGAERDEARGMPARKVQKHVLTLVDMLGEHAAILDLLRSFGRMSLFTVHDGSQYVSFNCLVEEQGGRLRSYLVVLYDIRRMAEVYTSQVASETGRLLRTTPVGDLPDRPLPIRWSAGFEFRPYELNRPELLRAMERTNATGRGEHLVIMASGSRWLTATVPVNHMSGTTMAMVVPMAKIVDAARGLRWRLAGLLVAGLLLVGLGSMTLRSRLLVPMSLLEAGARDVAGGDYSRRVPVLAHDELGALSTAFNEMSSGLQERDRLRRFISTAAFEAIRAGADSATGGRRQEVALLAADLRGFTTLSESASPERIVAALNDYFSLMDQVIAGHGGTVMKLVGDAILAMFEVRADLEHPARRAALAGLAMRAALRDLNKRWAATGSVTFENGVGIHWGPVVVGRIGSRHGRADFSLLGAPVADVQAFEAASKLGSHSRVVVSLVAWARCGGGLAAVPLAGREADAVELLGGTGR